MKKCIKKSSNEKTFETIDKSLKKQSLELENVSKSIISFKLIDSIKEVISHEKNDEKIILKK